jgi:hypothetical protein
MQAELGRTVAAVEPSDQEQPSTGGRSQPPGETDDLPAKIVDSRVDAIGEKS